MTDDILSQDNVTQDNLDPNKSYLDQMVGEGRKYKDTEELAKAQYNADGYIPLLTRQMDTLRSDYEKAIKDGQSRADLQALVDRLAKSQNSSSDNTPANDDNDTQQPGVKPEQLENQVLSIVQKMELNRKQSDNAKLIQDKLRERHGNNYPAVVKEQIEELGITSEDFNNMARIHPQLLIKTLGLDQPVTRETYQAPPRSRNDQFVPQVNQKRTESYYEKLRQSNPTLYHDSKTTVQMHKDAQALGRAFFDLN